jgi:non-specific serine/threonine protein kinase
MSSSPPTPPSTGVDDTRRFNPITLPCEWVEDYRPGGYHPVIRGDFFNNGQYKVIRKLGDGSYSTVWLARDLKYVPPRTLYIIPTHPLQKQ